MVFFSNNSGLSLNKLWVPIFDLGWSKEQGKLGGYNCDYHHSSLPKGGLLRRYKARKKCWSFPHTSKNGPDITSRRSSSSFMIKKQIYGERRQEKRITTTTKSRRRNSASQTGVDLGSPWVKRMIEWEWVGVRREKEMSLGNEWGKKWKRVFFQKVSQTNA